MIILATVQFAVRGIGTKSDIPKYVSAVAVASVAISVGSIGIDNLGAIKSYGAGAVEIEEVGIAVAVVDIAVGVVRVREVGAVDNTVAQGCVPDVAGVAVAGCQRSVRFGAVGS